MPNPSYKMDCCLEPDDSYVVPILGDINWLAKPVTRDQRYMNNYIQIQDLDSKRILHIGIGHSSVSLLPNVRKASKIIGVTLSNEECKFGNNLKLENYHINVINKYGTSFSNKIREEQPFDIISDNNIFLYTCCLKHAKLYFSLLVNSLSDKGIIITHALGLGCVHQTNRGMPHPTDLKSLRKFCEEFNLVVDEEKDGVYIIRKVQTSAG